MSVADINEYLTVSETATELRCALRTVYGYLERGLLPSERKGPLLLIPATAVRGFIPPEPGNPALKRTKA